MSNPLEDFLSEENISTYMKIVPKIMLLFISLLAIGLHVENVILEIYVSYVPQVLIVLWGLLVLLFTLYARLIIRNGWRYCLDVMGKADFIVFCLLLFLMAYTYTFSLFTFSHPAQAENQSKKSLNVATYNKLFTNDDYQSVVEFLELHRVDIVGFQEISEDQLEYIRSELGFDYSFSSNCDCSAGTTEVALLSRYPIANNSVAISSPNSGVIQTDVNLDRDHTITVFVAHIVPPFSPQHFNGRADVYDQLSRIINAQNNDTFLMGDFNTTVFSPQLRNFSKQTENYIKNVEIHNWPKCSWYGFTSIACARIDHVFMPKSWQVGDVYIGEPSGSDHRPVLAEIYL